MMMVAASMQSSSFFLPNIVFVRRGSNKYYRLTNTLHNEHLTTSKNKNKKHHQKNKEKERKTSPLGYEMSKKIIPITPLLTKCSHTKTKNSNGEIYGYENKRIPKTIPTRKKHNQPNT